MLSLAPMPNTCNIALGLRQGRIAPRFDHPELLAVYTLDENARVLQRREHPVQHLGRVEICRLLSALQVRILICGGLLEECRHLLDKEKISHLDNIIGSEDLVLQQYLQGALQPGMVLD